MRELQKRLLISVGALLVAGIGVYYFYAPILEFLRSPLGTPLYYTSPAGSFAFVMKICFMGALALSIPVLVYNLIMFVRPAYETSLPKSRIYLMTIASSFLALAGAAFAFFLIVPGSLHFFAGFQVSGLSALISADSYLNFVTSVIITFIIVFQLPLLISFIDKVKPLKPKSLFKMEKWVVLGSLMIALIVPFAFDLTTSLFIAAPIIVLYNISIVIILVQHARQHRTERSIERRRHVVSAIPSSSLALESLTFEDLVGSPVLPPSLFLVETTIHEEYTSIVHSGISTSSAMDVQTRRIRPEKVSPAAWVHRVAQPIARNPRARIIADIVPIKSANLFSN
jgi:sec-independent protein translocase protein TatC